MYILIVTAVVLSLVVLYHRLLSHTAMEPGVVPSQAYELLTACGGGLALESPETRVEVAHKLWHQFKRKGELDHSK